MSIRQYPKHQFVVDLVNDTETDILRVFPSFKGYLCNARLKIVKKNYIGGGRAKIILRHVGSDVVISESNWVNYDDIGIDLDFYHSLVRFDFDDIAIRNGIEYQLSIFQESAGAMDDNSFFGYSLDYNFPVNQHSGDDNPLNNLRFACELFMKKEYYEFS
jgi:hypothetical protein